MVAQVLSLEHARCARSFRTPMIAYSPSPMAMDGWGLMLAATSFWVEYAVAMASFHHALLSTCCSQRSKQPKT